MDDSQLKNLPSTFYRVAVKCLVFNNAGQLLVLRTNANDNEIPGGGWEHGESLDECVQRELKEELGVNAQSIGPVKMVLQGQSDRGWRVLRVALEVVLDSTDFSFDDPEIVEAFYVSQPDFSKLNFGPSDASFADAADQIWANH